MPPPARAARAAPTDQELLDDERLTALGLLIETSAGLAAIWTPELEARGLSASSFEVMLRLARSPGERLRMSELSAQCALTNSGLTRVVDRLARRQLVSREPCPTDRRGFFAVLTPEGRAQVVAALPDHLATIDRTLTGVLEPQELAALLSALRKVRAVVKPGSDPEVAAQD